MTRVVHGRKLEVPGGDEVGGVRALGHGGDAGGVRESTAVGQEHRPVVLAPDLWHYTWQTADVPPEELFLNGKPIKKKKKKNTVYFQVETMACHLPSLRHSVWYISNLKHPPLTFTFPPRNSQWGQRKGLKKSFLQHHNTNLGWLTWKWIIYMRLTSSHGLQLNNTPETAPCLLSSLPNPEKKIQLRKLEPRFYDIWLVSPIYYILGDWLGFRIFEKSAYTCDGGKKKVFSSEEHLVPDVPSTAALNTPSGKPTVLWLWTTVRQLYFSCFKCLLM